MMAKKHREQKVTEASRAPQQEYMTGAWGGIAQYQCRHCAFDVLDDRKAILRHLMDAHGSTAALEELLVLEAVEKPQAEPEAEHEAEPIRENTKIAALEEVGDY
jgi:hypothetical protein